VHLCSRTEIMFLEIMRNMLFEIIWHLANKVEATFAWSVGEAIRMALVGKTWILQLCRHMYWFCYQRISRSAPCDPWALNSSFTRLCSAWCVSWRPYSVQIYFTNIMLSHLMFGFYYLPDSKAIELIRCPFKNENDCLILPVLSRESSSMRRM
jgi:hypothetical protein